MKREDILHAVIEDSTDEVEFLKNLAVMTDVLVERDHPDAGYFGEITKHLIGRHQQKDHDPTKGKGHSRPEHIALQRQAQRGSKEAQRNLYPRGAVSHAIDAAGAFALGTAPIIGAVAASRAPGAARSVSRYGRDVSQWARGGGGMKSMPVPVRPHTIRNITRTRESAQASLNQARQRYEQMLAQHRSRPQVFTGDMPMNTVNFGQSGNIPFRSRPDFLPALVRR